jgi:hypothetical protein
MFPVKLVLLTSKFIATEVLSGYFFLDIKGEQYSGFREILLGFDWRKGCTITECMFSRRR